MVLLMASCTVAQFVIFGMLDQTFACWCAPRAPKGEKQEKRKKEKGGGRGSSANRARTYLWHQGLSRAGRLRARWRARWEGASRS